MQTLDFYDTGERQVMGGDWGDKELTTPKTVIIIESGIFLLTKKFLWWPLGSHHSRSERILYFLVQNSLEDNTELERGRQETERQSMNR